MSELQDRIDDARVVADAVACHELPMPEVSTDQDGDFLFEWYASSGNLVAIWCHDHHISYSGLLDGNGRHGRSEHLESLPDGCLDLLLAVAQKMPAVTVNAAP